MKKWVRAAFTNRPLGIVLDAFGVVGATVIVIVALLFMTAGVGHAQTGTTSLKLQWDKGTETDLEAYKIFRGTLDCTAQGPLQPLLDTFGSPVTVPATLNTYTDNSVPLIDGSVCYEITVYDTAKNESGRSNRATKVLNLNPPLAPRNLIIVVP